MTSITSITYLLQHISFSLTKQSDQILREQLGIGTSQYKILHLLQDNPQLTQREIADNLGQTEASISRQISLMLEHGQLQIIISPDDHRKHLTVPTRKGLRLSEAADAALEKYFAPLVTDVKAKQFDQLHSMLSTLHSHVCVIAKAGQHRASDFRSLEQSSYIRYLAGGGK